MPAGKATTLIRKKGNGQIITEAEWNRAVSYVKGKFAEKYVRDLKRLNCHGFSNPGKPFFFTR